MKNITIYWALIPIKTQSRIHDPDSQKSSFGQNSATFPCLGRPEPRVSQWFELLNHGRHPLPRGQNETGKTGHCKLHYSLLEDKGLTQFSFDFLKPNTMPILSTNISDTQKVSAQQLFVEVKSEGQIHAIKPKTYHTFNSILLTILVDGFKKETKLSPSITNKTNEQKQNPPQTWMWYSTKNLAFQVPRLGLIPWFLFSHVRLKGWS